MQKVNRPGRKIRSVLGTSSKCCKPKTLFTCKILAHYSITEGHFLRYFMIASCDSVRSACWYRTLHVCVQILLCIASQGYICVIDWWISWELSRGWTGGDDICNEF